MRATILLLAAVAIGASSAKAETITLEKVAIIQRHGVRAPTKSSEALSKYSRDPWRTWLVAPGDLTERGARGAEAMGASLRKHYTNLLPKDDCRAVAVWADGGDTRTRQSGDAAARGLQPACPGAARFAPPPVDPLFSPDDAGLCPPKSAEILADITKTIPSGDLNRLGPAYDKAKAAMAAILYPGLNAEKCRAEPQGACLFVTGTNAFKGEGWDARLDGPLAVGSSLAENLLLEYAEGFSNAGWGRADSTKALASVMALHNLFARLTRRTPTVAGRKGALLAGEIAALMTGPEGRAPAVPGAPRIANDARLILFLGHDGNLSNLAGIYSLDWDLPGQPDATAPNTALAFERIRTADGKRYVRVKLFYQTLAQMRTARPKARILSLSLPQCHNGPGASCPLERFVALTSAHIASDCFVPH